jgi:hypothetical protein
MLYIIFYSALALTGVFSFKIGNPVEILWFLSLSFGALSGVVC